MMQPSEKVLDTFRCVPFIGVNLAELVLDFNESFGCGKLDQQPLIDTLFVAFLQGVMVPIDPGSHFNKEYKFIIPGVNPDPDAPNSTVSEGVPNEDTNPRPRDEPAQREDNPVGVCDRGFINGADPAGA